MHALDSNVRSLEVVLAGAVTTNQLPVVATFQDVDRATLAGLSVQTVCALTAGATAVAVVPAPPSSSYRQLTELTVQNADTASATVTIRLNDNGTTYASESVTLAAGDHYHYVRGAPAKVYDSTGATKNLWGLTAITSTGSTITVTGTGTVNVDFNLGHANAWTAKQTFGPNLITSPSNTTSEVYGDSATCSGNTSVVLGNGANSSASSPTGRTVVLGHQATVATTGSGDSVVVGYQASATGGRFQTVLGASASSTKPNTVVIGASASSTGDSGVAIGLLASVSTTSGIAIGNNNTLSATTSFTLGTNNTVSSGAQEFALGNACTVTHKDAMALGWGVSTTRERELVIGGDTNNGAGAYSGGFRLRFMATTSTNTIRDIGIVSCVWPDNTDASRKGGVALYACDASGTDREGFRVESSGSAAKISMFGAAAVAQQGAAAIASTYVDAGFNVVHDSGTWTGGVGASAYTIDAIVAALKNYGLLAQ